MKNKLFIIATILLAVATTIFAVSCGKDKENENNANDGLSKTITQNFELSETDQSLVAFGEKMKNAADGKDAVTMPLEEGMNTLTNYQNLMLCNASFYSNDMVIDTIKSKLNVTNGEVSLSDLYGIYESTRTDILARFNSLTGSPKTIYMIITTVDGDPQNTGMLDINTVSYMVNSVDVSETLYYFDTTDYWHDFNLEGKCGYYEGLCDGRDCVTELDSRLAVIISFPDCGEGYTRYLTNITDHCIYAHNLPDPSSPNGIYALPWRGFYSNPMCVSPSDMEYYLNVILNIYQSIAQTATKDIVFFRLFRHKYYKQENHHQEAYIHYKLADVNCTPIGNGI
ncbi:MAG: hypothetical protein IKM99_09500 [Bacteroidales bacterium]|nr:hypothetical protein [Bacteroidales bacterium]